MVCWKATKFAVVAIGVLVLVGLVIAAVSAIVSLVVTLVAAIVTLLVLAGLTIGTVRGVRWLRSSGSEDAESVPTSEASVDPVDRLTERYVAGELTESEFERMLDLEFGGPDRDEIDRELERSRNW